MGHISYMTVLLSATVVLFLALPMAYAVSPYSQFESGIPLEEVQCMDEKVLMESPRGTPACVREPSVEKLVQRGFVLVSQMPEKIKPIDELSSKPVLNPDEQSMIDIETLDVASGNNRFAVDFYKQISDSDENIFFSPTSIYTASSVLYEGAGSSTARQFQQVFGFESDLDKRHEAIEQFMSEINQEDQHTTLSLANALWIADWFNVRDTYQKNVREFYDANVETFDLVKYGEKRIDDWAADNTNNKITDVIGSDDIKPQTAAIITNAIYFKGMWLDQFLVKDTHRDTFFKTDIESTEADFMVSQNEFELAKRSNEASVLKMPYAGGRLSMLVILPDDKNGIKSIEESLTYEMIETWKDDLFPTLVTVSFPKFTMNMNFDLIEPLSNLGIKDAFNPASADLRRIGDAQGLNLFIDRASHSSFVNVDEEGTEAAAVTTFESRVTSSPSYQPFVADHPFIFIIQDDASGAILFMGRVSDPTL